MPTYQYLCRDCEHRFDTVQSIHDDALTVCPECGGTVRRVLHPVGVTFKGSGFYRTDSREKKASPVPAGKAADTAGKDGSGTKDAAAGKEATADKAPAPAKTAAVDKSSGGSAKPA